jgi:hypothetical protein
VDSPSWLLRKAVAAAAANLKSVADVAALSDDAKRCCIGNGGGCIGAFRSAAYSAKVVGAATAAASRGGGYRTKESNRCWWLRDCVAAAAVSNNRWRKAISRADDWFSIEEAAEAAALEREVSDDKAWLCSGKFASCVAPRADQDGIGPVAAGPWVEMGRPVVLNLAMGSAGESGVASSSSKDAATAPYAAVFSGSGGSRSKLGSLVGSSARRSTTAAAAAAAPELPDDVVAMGLRGMRLHKCGRLRKNIS